MAKLKQLFSDPKRSFEKFQAIVASFQNNASVQIDTATLGQLEPGQVNSLHDAAIEMHRTYLTHCSHPMLFDPLCARSSGDSSPDLIRDQDYKVKSA